DLAAPGSFGGVDEDHPIGMADRFREFRRQLMDRQYLDRGIGHQVAHTLGGERADGVVAAEPAAVADDQHRSHQRRSSNVPSCARNSISSAMRPSAWVEQLRQGSKVRITASTRLSMPSEILVPCTKWRATWSTPRFMAALLWPVAMIRLAKVMSPS